MTWKISFWLRGGTTTSTHSTTEDQVRELRRSVADAMTHGGTVTLQGTPEIIINVAAIDQMTIEEVK